jgi:hypothetical protein
VGESVVLPTEELDDETERTTGDLRTWIGKGCKRREGGKSALGKGDRSEAKGGAGSAKKVRRKDEPISCQNFLWSPFLSLSKMRFRVWEDVRLRTYNRSRPDQSEDKLISQAIQQVKMICLLDHTLSELPQQPLLRL